MPYQRPEEGPGVVKKLPLKEVLFLADQASEAGIKTLPGDKWGMHYGVSASERANKLQGLLNGSLKPEDVAADLKPDAIVYDIEDVKRLGVDAVIAKIRDYSSTIVHYNYSRFAQFLYEMRGSDVDLKTATRLYEGLARSRIRKRMHDAYGYTGRKQIETSLANEAEWTIQNFRDLSPFNKVLQALKLDWLSRDMRLVQQDQLREVVDQLSAEEKELYDELKDHYRQFVQSGDKESYKKMVESISKRIQRVKSQVKDEDVDQEEEKLKEQLEDFMDQTGFPGTPDDPAIPPEDEDEYHTPETSPGDQESEESLNVKPIFTIKPAGNSKRPMTGSYCSGRKSYYDAMRKVWSKKKKLGPYSSNVSGQERQTISSRTKGGLISIPIPANYALDAGSLNYSGAKPTLLRDQNGCSYIQSDGPCEFEVDFLKESPPYINPPIPEDNQGIYKGSLSNRTESYIQNLSGSGMKRAMAVQGYVIQNHYYPGGGDLKMAQALQLKLRQSPADQYVQALDRSEYLECYSANTLCIAMLRKAGIPARLVIGHKVESVSEGEAHITQSTGHAWAEFWDGKNWRRLDATPQSKKEDKKDEEKDQDKKGEKGQDADDGGVEPGGEPAGDQGGEQGGEQGGDQGGEQGGEQGGDQGGEQGGEQGSEQGGEQGSEQGGDQEGQQSAEDLPGEVREAIADQAQDLQESVNDLDEASESEFNDAQENLEQAEEKMEEMKETKKDLQDQIQAADDFQTLEAMKEKAEEADLIEEMKEELKRQAEAKEEQMKEELKKQMEEATDDGFMDETIQDELSKSLEEMEGQQLDQIKRQIEQEARLHDEYEAIKEDVEPLVEEWYRHFVEKLPREEEIDVDEDSRTRQGKFDRRSVMRAKNLLFGTIKNPRIFKSDIRPKFIASIVLDVSGSMQGHKLEMARKLLVFYCELFTRISEHFGYIRFSIDTFSNGMNEIKTYEQDYDSHERYDFTGGVRDTIKARLMKGVHVQGGTDMLPAIKKAARALTDETFEYPDHASAMYFIGDGEDMCGNSSNIREFMKNNDEERGFGEHMHSAVMLGDESQRQTLADLFGDEHTTVADNLDDLIEENMQRFDDDISSYLENKMK